MIIDQTWIKRPETQRVMRAFSDAGHDAYFVGGCVRNALLEMPVADIDIATSATPEETMVCAKSAGLKVVPTGIEHGTITLVSGGVPHEVTTYRADVDTDGRHATVRFSRDIAEDAARRDFTMNALYADAEGQVEDILGGMSDLVARRVRFIGDAHARIREDYLRSLRFFRFFAWYGDQAEGLDAEGLAAVAENLDGLAGLSKERIGAEVLKVLAAPSPEMALAAMQHSGVLGAILPGSDGTRLGPLVHLEQSLNYEIDPVLRLAALGGSGQGDALRLSRKQSKLLHVYLEEAGSMTAPEHLGYVHGEQVALGCLLLRSALLEVPLPERVIERVRSGAASVFPVKARDLSGDFQGKALGEKLRALEAIWIESGMTASREDLLS